LALFPTEPADAICCAVQMSKVLPVVNNAIAKLGFEPIKTGTGIHMGEAMLGTVGIETRMGANVVSDVVNSAARIEGLNKVYGTEILITETILAQMKDPERFTMRLLDKVQTKGKSQQLVIYEVLDGLPEEIQGMKLSTLEAMAEAWEFYITKDFTKAKSIYQECLKHCPGDMTAELLFSRCIEYLKTGVPEDWNGTTKLYTK